MTIDNLLTREEFLKLSMSDWEKKLIQMDGKCFPHILIRVLEAKVKYECKLRKTFNHNEKDYWFDSEKRASLINAANFAPKSMQIILGDEIVEWSKDDVILNMLALEYYSSLCFITMSQHLQNIKKLYTLGDMINYDYTIGYPEKITL